MRGRRLPRGLEGHDAASTFPKIGYTQNRMRRLTHLPRSLFQIIYDTENLILLLIGIGIGLALTLFVFPVLLPQVAPFITAGVSCNSLAPPQGGNSRSLLSFEGDDTQKLQLDVQIRNTTLIQGEPLQVDVIFENQDVGPVILFMPEIDELVPNSPATLGVSLEIRNIATNARLTYGITAGSIPTSATFEQRTLHLLRSHEWCSQSYTLDLVLEPGEYSLLARYTNTQAGVAPAPLNAATPLPLFADQGVWNDGTIASREERFAINPPPTAVPQPIP